MEEQFTKIVKEYILYTSKHQKRPVSITAFMKEIGLSESEFYKHASSFKDLEIQIWKKLAETTITQSRSEEVYSTYGSREKLLSFYYTLVENLKEHREFYQISYNHPTAILPPAISKRFYSEFDDFIQDIIDNGIETGEINRRQFLDRAYNKVFKSQLHFLVRYALEDHSKDFEATDEAIERAVNLSYDLLGPNLFDEIFSFGKFLFENKKSK
jgi:hypothetical protein